MVEQSYLLSCLGVTHTVSKFTHDWYKEKSHTHERKNDRERPRERVETNLYLDCQHLLFIDGFGSPVVGYSYDTLKGHLSRYCTVYAQTERVTTIYVCHI